MEKKILKEITRTGKIIFPYLRRYTTLPNKDVQKIIQHVPLSKSYMFRAFLTRLGYEINGGNFKKILPAVAAIELMHDYSFMIDDIMDESTERRGKKSTHRLYGIKNTILASGILYSLATLSLIEGCKHLPKETFIQILQYFKKTCIKAYLGEYNNINCYSNKNFSLKDYFDMIYNMTGAMVEFSLVIGALMGRANKKTLRALKEYGRYTGMAFQIRDDLVEVVRERKKYGKEGLYDLKNGIKNLIIIYALSKTDEKNKRFIYSVLGKKNIKKTEIKKILNIFYDSGAIDFAKKTLKNYADKAAASIKNIEKNESKLLLEELAGFISNI